MVGLFDLALESVDLCLVVVQPLEAEHAAVALSLALGGTVASDHDFAALVEHLARVHSGMHVLHI